MVQGELRRGGLTPACGSAHARNGRGLGKQRPKTRHHVLPRGAKLIMIERRKHGAARNTRSRFSLLSVQQQRYTLLVAWRRQQQEQYKYTGIQ